MSASQDKKKRQEAREAGTERHQLAAEKEAREQHKSKVRWTIVSILVALLIVLILVVNSGLFYSVLPAVRIGDVSYTNAEYQYYYYSSYYSFCNNYSNYLSYFSLSTTSSLSSQSFDPTYLSLFGITVPDSLSGATDATWADYFRETALSSMKQITALYEKAVAAGYTLSDTDSASIDEQIANFDTYAQSGNYSSAKQYITAAYGRGCTEKTIRHLMEMQYIASAYTKDTYDGFTYTPEELSAWYDKNKDSYDTFDYLYYYVAAETETVTPTASPDASASPDATADPAATATPEPTPTQEVTDATMAKAKTAADAIAAAATDKEAFGTAVADYAADATPTESTLVMGSQLPSTYSEWMLDSSRKTGDVTVAEVEGSGYYVVMFLGRDSNQYKTVTARHILIKAVDEDGDGTYSDAELKTAEDKINDIYDQWKSGDKTEDSFAALATQYSEDTGSASDGGLIEHIYKGETVTEFNDFCFDTARKAGDTAVVKGESSSYTGYHLIYYVGTGENYCDYIADTGLRTEAYSSWLTSAQEGYDVSKTLVFRFAEK